MFCYLFIYFFFPIIFISNHKLTHFVSFFISKLMDSLSEYKIDVCEAYGVLADRSIDRLTYLFN